MNSAFFENLYQCAKNKSFAATKTTKKLQLFLYLFTLKQKITSHPSYPSINCIDAFLSKKLAGNKILITFIKYKNTVGKLNLIVISCNRTF